MRLHRFFAAVSSIAILAGAAQAQTTTTAPQPKTPVAPAPAGPATSGMMAAPMTTAAPGAMTAQTGAPSSSAAKPTAPVTQVVANGDLIETARASGEFTILLKALDATNLTGVLKNNKGLTVFAPTDAAFAAVPQAELARLMTPANASTLQKILAYHVINTTVDSARVKGTKGPIKTVEGSELLVDGSGDHIMVDGATVVQADIKATNGTLHVIDKVLMPADLPAVTAALSAAPSSADCQTSPSDPMTSSGPAGAAPPVAPPPAASDPVAPPPAAPVGDMTKPGGDMPAPAAPPADVSDPAAAPSSAADPAAAPAPGMPAGAPTMAQAAPPPAVSPPMQPIPDTAENRAKYGKPQSNAGKNSAPKGN